MSWGLDTGDRESWQQFNDIYGRLIRGFALKAGLTETEADEVVQETLIAAARNLPDYRYDPAVCSFKTWLLNLSQWRVTDQLRKRLPTAPARPAASDSTRTATIDRVPDPGGSPLEKLWDEEWLTTLLEAACERVKREVDARQWQIFDLYALKGWAARDVARALGRGKRVVVGAAAVGLLAVALTTIWRWSMGDGASDRPTTSVFVLPFRYEAPAAEPVEETERALWLCGRMTDAFIDGLAVVPGLSTGPRKSDWLRSDEDEVRCAIVRTNATRYLLTGRVDRTNDLLRLYGRHDDAPRWERTFAGAMNEVIGLERGALEHIARVLGRKVNADAGGKIDQVLTNNLEAYRWFLRARAHHLTVSRNEYRKALDCFDRALALDRKYVTAHEGYIELFREFFGVRPPEELWPVLAERARMILALDDTSFVAHDRLLDKMILYDRDWERAIVGCESQSKIWPERLVSWSVRYRFLGRTNESRLYHERLKESRSVNAIERLRALQHLAFGESVWRNHDEAIRLARRSIELAPDGTSIGQYNLGRCLLWAGRYREAIDALLQPTSDWPSPEMDGMLGRAYALLGDQAKALEYLARLEESERAGDADPYFLAWIYEALGNTDQALEHLDRAIDYRSECIVHTEFGGLRTDPAWDKLRDDPRFEALCRRVGMGKDQWPK